MTGPRLIKEKLKEERRARITRRFIIYLKREGVAKTAYRIVAEIENLSWATVKDIVAGRR